MRFEFESPSVVDASDHKAESTGRAATVSFRPHVRQGQSQILMGYLYATGERGAKAISRVLFNPRTGKFMVHDVSTPTVECAFDLDPAVIEANRKKASKKPLPPAGPVAPARPGPTLQPAQINAAQPIPAR